MAQLYTGNRNALDPVVGGVFLGAEDSRAVFSRFPNARARKRGHEIPRFVPPTLAIQAKKFLQLFRTTLRPYFSQRVRNIAAIPPNDKVPLDSVAPARRRRNKDAVPGKKIRSIRSANSDRREKCGLASSRFFSMLTLRRETIPGGVRREMRRAQVQVNSDRKAGPAFRGEFPSPAE